MNSATILRRLNKLKASIPAKPNLVAETALREIIDYLDGLAARKASGDKYAQREIEEVSAIFSKQK